MSALLAQAQQVQQQLMEAQEALANSEVHGQAGGGLVQVTMKGSGEVVAVAIDPKVVDPSDVETLQDLIVRRCRLFDFLKLKICDSVVAIDNSFHWILGSSSVAVAVVG